MIDRLVTFAREAHACLAGNEEQLPARSVSPPGDFCTARQYAQRARERLPLLCADDVYRPNADAWKDFAVEGYWCLNVAFDC